MTLNVTLDTLGLPGNKPLLHNIALTVQPGTIHTLMGPSGSGKSSLLLAIAGQLASPMKANIAVALDGHQLDHTPAHLRQIGMLFQDDLLFPHLSVFDNLLFAVPRAHADRHNAVAKALAQIDMSAKANNMPHQLSGGERTRAALMRALLAKPKALLLDEPFAKLDAQLRERLRDWVYTTLSNAGVPTLVVSHDAQDIASTQALSRLIPSSTLAGAHTC
ncbi:ATP-binding cassette domain-containing protein [Comamonadaceae bacterium M7527]|nr:ATP-binding cassette domain-containing protein [Comamonadaceae bacterium M7527]